MSKKKNIRAEDITEKDILSIYDRVLPLLYDNPLNLDPLNEFIESLRTFISFDNYHFVMDDPDQQPELGQLLWTVQVYTKKPEWNKFSVSSAGNDNEKYI
jgi:hypothetical protein